MMSALHERVSGVLMHVTSLPSAGGVGDMGPDAHAFVDFLVSARQRLWQVLPLSPTGYGNSPYSALSAFAGNPLLISTEYLAEQGWIAKDRLGALVPGGGPCNFGNAFEVKLPLIEEAACYFLDHAHETDRVAFQNFTNANAYWLNDWAMYAVLRRRFEHKSWYEWPREYALREPAALDQLQRECRKDIDQQMAVQFFFEQQWKTLRGYANQRGVRLLGDVAIFVSYDSADVWTHPNIFELDEHGRPIRVAGVPPDYFSATGQLWGNPLYRWDVLEQSGFGWWVDRMRRALELYDRVRLDHFRGFEAYWAVDAGEPTAANGKWVKAPGRELFTRLREVFGGLPLVAEDLGVITPEVDALRDSFELPGMKVLQFAFGDYGGHAYLPHRYPENSVVYTGTHDNNTTVGWWQDNASDTERHHAGVYFGPIENPERIVWSMIRAALASVARTAILPLQDVLGLGSAGRMNVPAAADGNWGWRFEPGALTEHIATQLAAIVDMTDRDGRTE